MAVSVVPFGYTKDGKEVKKITLDNGKGMQVSLLDYGATIQAMPIDGKDIVLGYDSMEGYLDNNGSYIGATIGRVCNRIADGEFTLNGETVKVFINEPDRHVSLHGGKSGFDQKIWEFSFPDGEEGSRVVFSRVSPDGEENYPGNLTVKVDYALTQDNALWVRYTATTDKDTPVNLTNHSYFNLNGCDGKNVLDTVLTVKADAITPVNDVLIPTGEYMPVAGTPLDFRQGKTIGEAVAGTHPQVKICGGVDHNFVFRKEKNEEPEAVVIAESRDSGLRLICGTNLPGIQIYTANFLDENHGKYGKTWGQYGGFCLETQFFPDSVNQPDFPSIILHPGETYYAETYYRVEKL